MGTRGCTYSPVPPASNFSGGSRFSKSDEAGASSCLTQSFTPPMALDHSQSMRIVCSSNKKHSIPEESRMLLARRALGRSRHLRIVKRTDNGASAGGKSRNSIGNPLRESSVLSASFAGSVKAHASRASCCNSPSVFVAYHSAKCFRVAFESESTISRHYTRD